MSAKHAFFLVTVLCVAGCTTEDASKPAVASSADNSPRLDGIDQANLCEVSVWRHDDVAELCKAGQKIVFLPTKWGNEQLPVFFAAVNCDLRYSVVLTPGAVTCIYGPITPKPATPNGDAG